MDKNLLRMSVGRALSTLASALLLSLLASSAQAVTFYPTEDTYSTIDYSTGRNPVVTKRFLTSAAGVTGSLYVSKSHSAFIQFNAAAQLAGATVTGARLTIYFPLVTKAGTLDVCQVSSVASSASATWTETFKPATEPEPNQDAFFYQILPASVAAKHFVTVDVTPEVQGWVSGAHVDNGFAIVADISSPSDIASVLLGAKEGPGSGYPAVLEVDVDNLSGGSVVATTATFTSNVGFGTTTPDTRFPLTIQGEYVAQTGNSTELVLENSTGVEKWHLQLEGMSGNLGFTETGVADDRFVLAAGGECGDRHGEPVSDAGGEWECPGGWCHDGEQLQRQRGRVEQYPGDGGGGGASWDGAGWGGSVQYGRQPG